MIKVNNYFCQTDQLNKIKTFFETYNNQHWLQFPGGAGGEFFANLISKYSTEYEDLLSDTVVNEYNRTMISLPKFYKLMASVPAERGNMEDLCNGVIRDAKILKLDLDQELENAAKYIDYGNKKYLIRVHYSINDYFNTQNSWAIVPDTSMWIEYVSILKVLKAGSFKMNLEHTAIYFDEYVTKRGCDREQYDKALQWITDNLNGEHIYFGYIVCIEYLDEIGGYENLFSMSLVDIYNFFYNKALEKKHVPWSPIYSPEFGNWSKKFLQDKITIIEYSKIFEPGYLGSFFNIDNKEFDAELLSWHDTNLKLIEAHGFDIKKFKL